MMNSQVKPFKKCNSINNSIVTQSHYFQVDQSFNFKNNQNESKIISSKILQKHIEQDEHPLFILIQKYFQLAVQTIKPFYSITKDRLINNIKGIFTSRWQFQLNEQQIQKNIQQQLQFIKMSHYLVNIPSNNNNKISQSSLSGNSSRIRRNSSINITNKNIKNEYKLKYNKSIFMFIWGPISLMILTHLMSNNPYSYELNEQHNLKKTDNKSIDVIVGGFIDIMLMVLLSFVLFVFFKVLKSDKIHSYFQHLCISSYISLITIVFSIICSSTINLIVIPCCLVYILVAGYLHINIYNQNIKPNLLELVALSFIILFFYTAAAVMFYQYYHIGFNYNDQNASNLHKYTHYYLFQSNGQNFIHQREFIH